MKNGPQSFGFDLDNTLIDYGPSVVEFCRMRYLPEMTSVQDLRRYLQESLGGDDSWQEAQSFLYLDGLKFARPADGSMEFLDHVSKMGVNLLIISHKTRTTQTRFGSLDFRTPALEWIKNSDLSKFFKASNNIYFAETRVEKIQEISFQRPKWYIDDLVEVLADSFFPIDTIPFLIGTSEPKKNNITTVRDFNELKKIWKPKT